MASKRPQQTVTPPPGCDINKCLVLGDDGKFVEKAIDELTEIDWIATNFLACHTTLVCTAYNSLASAARPDRAP